MVPMHWEDIYLRFRHDCNDAPAWHALQDRVRGWARGAGAGRSSHTVEDIVAETCAATVVGIHNARSAETFAGFAYGHFLNVRRRLLRDQSLAQRMELLHADMPLASPEDAPDAETIAIVRRAVAALPERERKAVSMRYFDELSAAAIAAELGVSSVNARRIVFNGLRRLRRELAA